LVEHLIRNEEVAGSIPAGGSTSEISTVVVRLLPKQDAPVRFWYLAPLYSIVQLLYNDYKQMKISKHYYHDKSVLSLLAVNAAFFLLAVSNVLLNVDTEASDTSIISYRSSRGIQVSGPTSDLFQFAIFALIVTTFSVILSIKLYSHRRHLAVSILGLNVITLILCLVVFNALTRTL
jgi:hypothetical protein